MTSLSLKEEDRYLKLLLVFIGYLVISTPVTVLYSYTEQRLALMWRTWLSKELLKKYFSNQAFYKISYYKGIDNPDQRIEEDVRTFTSITLSFFLILFNATLTIFTFTNVLWQISGNLITAVLCYSIFGSLITFLVGKPLIGLNFTQLRREADYRYKLVNIRDNAESIAFSKGNKKEFTRTRQRLKIAIFNFRKMISVNRNINFCITLYNNLKPVIPVVIVAPLYLKGNIEFGKITQATDGFVRVVEALSVLIQHFATISSIAAVLTRLGTFMETVEESAKYEGGVLCDIRGPNIEVVESDHIEFKNLTILTPNRDQKLIEELSFNLEDGGALIIGPSGNGKSSILRVVAGLWGAGDGQLYRPNLKRCFFIPQRTYSVLGTFKNQLLYGTNRSSISDKEIVDIVNLTGLHKTIGRIKNLDEEQNWSNILSTGELQRVSFARMFLSNAEYAFIDEGTTAIEPEAEEQLYTEVKKRFKGYISIGHQHNIAKFHKKIIVLLGGGKWRIEENE